MKITTTDGCVTAIAESLADVQTLLGLKQKNRPAGLMYKRKCPHCGKKIKHVDAHIKLNHTTVV